MMKILRDNFSYKTTIRKYDERDELFFRHDGAFPSTDPRNETRTEDVHCCVAALQDAGHLNRKRERCPLVFRWPESLEGLS